MRRLLAIAFLTLGLAACGGGGDDATTTATAPASSEPATTAEAPETTAAEGSAADDPCALVSDDDLAEAFPSGAPEGESNAYGAGFGECEWEDDAAYLSVSVVPAGNFVSDFADQLNVTGPVDSEALGEDAVSFPGVVGIGRASAGGVSVGFSKDDTGVIVAAKTGEEGDPVADLALATLVAESIAGTL